MAIELLKHQIEPTAELVDFLMDTRRKGILTTGMPGCGKTFVMASALQRVQAKGRYVRIEDRPWMINPVLVLAPTNCIIQHQRVFARAGIKNVEVMTGNSLGATMGELWIDWITKMVRGEIEYLPIWKDEFKPECVMVDECQQYKNPSAQRTKCLQAYVEQGGKLVFISGTPFQKACEAELILNACHITSKNSFDDFAWRMSPSGPTEDSPTAVKRIKEELQAYNCLIEIKNVRYPFKPKVKNYIFTISEWKEQIVNAAYEEYLEVRRKAGKSGTPQGVMAIWVAQNKFREKAELLRADEIAELAVNINANQGRAVIIASNFVATLRKCWEELAKRGISKDKISHLTGSQTAADKQKNIDNFQAGKTEFFLTTLKSGGTGLNLHHEVKEAKPRTVLLPPTWSIYEMFQCLFRTQRINNLSAPEQFICWYNIPIEMKVANRLEQRFDCLRELLDRKDDFIQSIFNGEVDNYIKEEFEKQQLTDEDGKEMEGETIETLFDPSMLDGEQ